MVDEFEYNALLLEMHLLREQNKMLERKLKVLVSKVNHPSYKGSNDDNR
jgi:hypothetical protein